MTIYQQTVETCLFPSELEIVVLTDDVDFCYPVGTTNPLNAPFTQRCYNNYTGVFNLFSCNFNELALSTSLGSTLLSNNNITTIYSSWRTVELATFPDCHFPERPCNDPYSRYEFVIASKRFVGIVGFLVAVQTHNLFCASVGAGRFPGTWTSSSLSCPYCSLQNLSLIGSDYRNGSPYYCKFKSPVTLTSV